MKYFRYCVLIALLPIAMAGRPAATPLQQQSRDNGQTTIDINVDRVNILFSVKDSKGKLITNLKQEDFRLTEDDKPQTIERLNLDRDLPLNIAMLMDRSSTVLDQLKLEKDAAIEFLNKTVKHGKDKALVIGFDTGVELLTLEGFTDDVEKLSDPIRKIRAGGGTSVFDAIYIAADQYLARQPQGQRRLIILLSDGQDNNSRKVLDDALKIAQKDEVVIYAINPNVPGSTSGNNSDDRKRGDKALLQLTDSTGGRAYFPKKLEDLETGFQSIGEEVRSQYSLIYSPTNKVRDGQFRRFKVEARNRQYEVKARPGYFAPGPNR